VLILLGSNLVGAAAGGVFFLTATWSLPLDVMGRYMLAVALQWVGVGLVGSGLSVATLRLAADRLERGDADAAAAVVRQAFRVAAGVAAVAALLGVAAASLLPNAATPELLVWVALWAGARSAIDTVRSGLLARHDYAAAGRLMLVTAVTGLMALGAVLATGPLTLRGLLMAHACGLGAGALVAWLRYSAPALQARAPLAELLRYARWPSLSEGTRLLQVNLGPLILIVLAGDAAAGLFGIGRYPAYLFDVVTVSLYQFWLSRAVRPEPGASLRPFLVRQLGLAAGIGAASVLLAIVARPLVALLGGSFREAAFLLPWSALDFAILLLLRPIESVYHGLHAPRLELLQRGIALPLLLVAALLLVPEHGALGMAWAHIAAGVATLGVAGWLLRRVLVSSESTAEAVA
jgi:O-antigen/teichoic acid export membrane protein